jgi:hypothetical protein
MPLWSPFLHFPSRWFLTQFVSFSSSMTFGFDTPASLLTPPVEFSKLLARTAITMDGLDIFAPFEDVDVARSRSVRYDRIVFVHGCVLTFT